RAARDREDHPREDRRSGHRLVAKQRADPLRVAERAGADAHDRPAVRDRMTQREVGAVVALLELRAVQRAAASVGRRAAALRALPRAFLRALLHEEEIDARVRRGVEHLLPPGRSALAASAVLVEPRKRFLVLARAR